MGESAAVAELVAEKRKLKKSLFRFDMIFFTVCAIVALDTIGHSSSYGAQAIFWLIVSGLTFLIPYGLITAELGAAFPTEGATYDWVRLAYGHFAGAVVGVLYWLSNPIWLGGTLAAVSIAAMDALWGSSFSGNQGPETVIGFLFIWVAVTMNILSLRYMKWVPNLGAIIRHTARLPRHHSGLLPDRHHDPDRGHRRDRLPVDRLRAPDQRQRGDGQPAERHPARRLHLWCDFLPRLRDPDHRRRPDPFHRPAEQCRRLRRGLPVRVQQRPRGRGAFLQPPGRRGLRFRLAFQRNHVAHGVRPTHGNRGACGFGSAAARLFLEPFRDSDRSQHPLGHHRHDLHVHHVLRHRGRPARLFRGRARPGHLDDHLLLHPDLPSAAYSAPEVPEHQAPVCGPWWQRRRLDLSDSHDVLGGGRHHLLAVARTVHLVLECRLCGRQPQHVRDLYVGHGGVSTGRGGRVLGGRPRARDPYWPSPGSGTDGSGCAGDRRLISV